MNHFISGIGRWLNRYRAVFALGFAGLLFLLAQSAFWVNQTLFDKQTFTSITQSVIQSEESRQAVANGIVDRALADKPILKRTISDKATKLLTGLLGTDLVTQATNLVIDKAYAYATSPNPEPIDFDLTAIKTPVARIVAFAEDQGREIQFDPNDIPDTVVLFEPTNLPDIHGYSVKMLWLGPLFWLSSLLIFSLYIYRGGRQYYAKRVYIVGAVIGMVALIGLLAGPVIPPPLAALTPQTGLRGIVEDLISAFLKPFTQQMIITLLITAVALFIFSLRFNILRLFSKLEPSRIAQKPEQVAKKPKK